MFGLFFDSRSSSAMPMLSLFALTAFQQFAICDSEEQCSTKYESLFKVYICLAIVSYVNKSAICKMRFLQTSIDVTRRSQR